ncbi:MAG: 3'(2'),5'-bisphosphate nucleotidase CysQ [Brevundimonas sp.]|nr:MAG: 3'(2'),5'-bisphosphate nucleotidase CysQ [Brevundimonas sp.]
MTDEELAGALAEQAGLLLLQARRGGLFSGKSLGDMGDAVAHQFLIKALAEHRPDDAVLSEEGARDGERLGHDRVWIIDPLDGTREYSEVRSDWAVHVALAIRGEAVVGAVAQPDSNQLYVSGSVEAGTPVGPLKIVVSRTRPPAQAQAAARILGAELVGMGSAGAKTMAVVRGDAHAYVHAGGQYEWDSAAPVAVARSAGLFVSRLDGSPLVYNRPDVYLPDLIVCRPELSDRLLKAVEA